MVSRIGFHEGFELRQHPLVLASCVGGLIFFELQEMFDGVRNGCSFLGDKD